MRGESSQAPSRQFLSFHLFSRRHGKIQDRAGNAALREFQHFEDWSGGAYFDLPSRVLRAASSPAASSSNEEVGPCHFSSLI